jgi:hypothetical protein
MEKIHYHGWDNCYRLSNETIELVVTTDVGPRIIWFGFSGGTNVFKNYDEMLGKTGGDEWRIYGGHRLWHAPEGQPRTYEPDNLPVKIENLGTFIRLVQDPEKTTRIEKQIDIYLDPVHAEVKLVHRLINHNLWAVELAPWALSVMAPGGKAIVPFPKRGSHTDGDLLPSNTITLWPYTYMSDPRWTWGKKYMLLQSQEGNEIAQKAGTNVTDGWAAYVNQGLLFVKYFDFNPAFDYADMGCNVETFTNEAMLELETLGPLCWLEPGETVEHVEIWKLFADVPTPQSEEEIDRSILPLIK